MSVARLCERCAGERATGGAAWCCFRYLCPACLGDGHQCRSCAEASKLVCPDELAAVAVAAAAVTLPAGLARLVEAGAL